MAISSYSCTSLMCASLPLQVCLCSFNIVCANVTSQWISINMHVMALQEICVKFKKKITLSNFQYCNYFLTHVGIYVCMYVCMYVHVYIYKKCWNQQNVLLDSIRFILPHTCIFLLSYHQHFYHTLSQCGFPVSCSAYII